MEILTQGKVFITRAHSAVLYTEIANGGQTWSMEKRGGGGARVYVAKNYAPPLAGPTMKKAETLPQIKLT